MLHPFWLNDRCCNGQNSLTIFQFASILCGPKFQLQSRYFQTKQSYFFLSNFFVVVVIVVGLHSFRLRCTYFQQRIPPEIFDQHEIVLSKTQAITYYTKQKPLERLPNGIYLQNACFKLIRKKRFAFIQFEMVFLCSNSIHIFRF